MGNSLKLFHREAYKMSKHSAAQKQDLPHLWYYYKKTLPWTRTSCTTPPWSSAPGTRVRSSPGSPVQWCRHFCTWLFVQWSNQPQIWYQMKSIWCKLLFKSLSSKIFFTRFINVFFLKLKNLDTFFTNLKNLNVFSWSWKIQK